MKHQGGKQSPRRRRQVSELFIIIVVILPSASVSAIGPSCNSSEGLSLAKVLQFTAILLISSRSHCLHRERLNWLITVAFSWKFLQRRRCYTKYRLTRTSNALSTTFLSGAHHYGVSQDYFSKYFTLFLKHILSIWKE